MRVFTCWVHGHHDQAEIHVAKDVEGLRKKLGPGDWRYCTWDGPTLRLYPPPAFDDLEIGVKFRFMGSDQLHTKIEEKRAMRIGDGSIYPVNGGVSVRPAQEPPAQEPPVKKEPKEYVVVTPMNSASGHPVFNYLCTDSGRCWVRSLDHASRFTKSEVKGLMEYLKTCGTTCLVTKASLVL